MAQDLFQLAYLSNASKAMSESDLEDILTVSRSNNDTHDITGFLMYVDNVFFQVIEGSKHNIDHLFQTLETDHRHVQVTKILYEPIEKRQFAQWKMAFLRLKSSNELEGFSDYLSDFAKGETGSLNLIDENNSPQIRDMIRLVRVNHLRG